MLWLLFQAPLSESAVAAAQQVDVIIGPNESLRQISNRLLGEANAWPLLLLYNGYDNVEEVLPGTKLTVPVGDFIRLKAGLDRSAAVIGKANQEGAAMLAEEEINTAMRLREQAMTLKKQAAFAEAIKIATQAVSTGESALAITRKGKNRSARAWLAEKTGTVQNRPPGKSAWEKTKLKQQLVEQERVRTLADSRATINFEDRSHLILEASSLAVISKMTENVVRKSFDTKVSVIEGDILFHLASLSKRREFTVNAPGVKTNIRSTSFRASLDQAHVTRVANYDGEIDVKAGGAQVTVKKNQGTKIPQKGQPTAPTDLLLPPELISPTPDQTLYERAVRFSWERVEEARGYVIEISRRADFRSLITSKTVNGEGYQWQPPGNGAYSVRLYTLDKDKQAGPYGEPRTFLVKVDTQPPYLVLFYPNRDMTVQTKSIEIRGEVEQNVSLEINGQSVVPDKNGRFKYPVTIVEPAARAGTIRVKAVDRAGNSSELTRKLEYAPPGRLLELDHGSTIISKVTPVVISGRLCPGSKVVIDGREVQLPQQFTHLMPLKEGEHQVQIEVYGPDKSTEKRQLTVVVDTTLPEISLHDLPAATVDNDIVIEGSLNEAAALTLNNVTIETTNNKFTATVPLNEGENEFLLLAEDRAGNRVQRTIRLHRDSQAPEISDKKLTPSSVQNGGIVQLRIKVIDRGVGTARVGSFTLAIGKRKFKGILKEKGADNSYSGSVFIPPDVSGTIEVREIELRDILGNVQKREQ